MTSDGFFRLALSLAVSCITAGRAQSCWVVQSDTVSRASCSATLCDLSDYCDISSVAYPAAEFILPLLSLPLWFPKVVNQVLISNLHLSDRAGLLFMRLLAAGLLCFVMPSHLFLDLLVLASSLGCFSSKWKISAPLWYLLCLVFCPLFLLFTYFSCSINWFYVGK